MSVLAYRSLFGKSGEDKLIQYLTDKANESYRPVQPGEVSKLEGTTGIDSGTQSQTATNTGPEWLNDQSTTKPTYEPYKANPEYGAVTGAGGGAIPETSAGADMYASNMATESVGDATQQAAWETATNEIGTETAGTTAGGVGSGYLTGGGYAMLGNAARKGLNAILANNQENEIPHVFYELTKEPTVEGTILKTGQKVAGLEDNSTATTLTQVFDPVGTGIKQVENWCCFIFISAYDELLPIVRRYRDEHMNEKNRRGYYRIADKIVPLMSKSKIFKWIVRFFMTGPMVSYGKYFYGEGKIGVVFKPVAKFWLGIFELFGKQPYIRKNGEVV
jgi:hypothetical protein